MALIMAPNIPFCSCRRALGKQRCVRAQAGLLARCSSAGRTSDRRKGAWSRSSLLTVYQPSRRRQRVAQLRAGGPPAKGNAGYFRRALCARLRLARRLTCSPATRPGASPPTSRSCRTCSACGQQPRSLSTASLRSSAVSSAWRLKWADLEALIVKGAVKPDT
jgi:hypothetical protein